MKENRQDKVCVMEELCTNIKFTVVTEKTLEDFFNINDWVDKENFLDICVRYGFPTKPISVAIEDYYIDATYRDVYYNYWAKFHFDWDRHCRRIFLFENEHQKNELFEGLHEDFLGTIVIRPSYSDEKDHTFGRTLLNPYKMVFKDRTGKNDYHLEYLLTTSYSVHLLGNKYTVQSFPFYSQDGVALKCAETSIQALCDFASASSTRYASVLPSDIQKNLKMRIPERILPSRGLYINDISFVLKELGFFPLIYVETEDKESVKESEDRYHSFEAPIGLIGCDDNTESLEPEGKELHEHPSVFKNWFHYYVESGIPLLIVTSPNPSVNRHASLVIGHGKKQESIDDCKRYHFGNLTCIDTAELYLNYIVQDDNIIPYEEEEIDKFTRSGNSKLDAFIVPLDKHVFLDAPSAVSIFDAFIATADKTIEDALTELAKNYRKEAESMEEDEKEEYLKMAEILTLSDDNPISIRYYLADGAEYKSFRISNATTLVGKDDPYLNKKFYGSIPLPKSIWVAEISTFKLYKEGYTLGEVVLDATASKLSKLNAIIAFRVGTLGVYRMPNEAYDVINTGLEGSPQYDDLLPFSRSFSNFSYKDIKYPR